MCPFSDGHSKSALVRWLLSNVGCLSNCNHWVSSSTRLKTSLPVFQLWSVSHLVDHRQAVPSLRYSGCFLSKDEHTTHGRRLSVTGLHNTGRGSSVSAALSFFGHLERRRHGPNGPVLTLRGCVVLTRTLIALWQAR